MDRIIFDSHVKYALRLTYMNQFLRQPLVYTAILNLIEILSVVSKMKH